MDDDDRTMWTVGSFCDPRLTPHEVFERTDVMAGPSHEIANISKTIVDLGMGVAGTTSPGRPPKHVPTCSTR